MVERDAYTVDVGGSKPSARTTSLNPDPKVQGAVPLKVGAPAAGIGQPVTPEPPGPLAFPFMHDLPARLQRRQRASLLSARRLQARHAFPALSAACSPRSLGRTELFEGREEPTTDQFLPGRRPPTGGPPVPHRKRACPCRSFQGSCRPGNRWPADQRWGHGQAERASAPEPDTATTHLLPVQAQRQPFHRPRWLPTKQARGSLRGPASGNRTGRSVRAG